MERVLTLNEVAEMIRVPTATLRYWRQRGTGPKSFKMGPRRVMYQERDVLQWIDAQYAALLTLPWVIFGLAGWVCGRRG